MDAVLAIALLGLAGCSQFADLEDYKQVCAEACREFGGPKNIELGHYGWASCTCCELNGDSDRPGFIRITNSMPWPWLSAEVVYWDEVRARRASLPETESYQWLDSCHATGGDLDEVLADVDPELYLAEECEWERMRDEALAMCPACPAGTSARLGMYRQAPDEPCAIVESYCACVELAAVDQEVM